MGSIQIFNIYRPRSVRQVIYVRARSVNATLTGLLLHPYKQDQTGGAVQSPDGQGCNSVGPLLQERECRVFQSILDAFPQ